MLLDLATLAVVTVFVTVLVGFLLLFSWWQNRDVRGLAHWGAAHLVTGAGLVLLVGRGRIPDAVSIGVANAIVLAGHGIFWAGFRRFEGRPASPTIVLAGSVLWLAACGIPEFYKSFTARLLVASLVLATYVIASAAESWRGRGERLLSRVPVIALLVLHAGLTVSRAPLLEWTGETGHAMVFSPAWLTLHAFETLLVTVVLAFLLLGMAKERGEAEQRRAASLDPLTGALNRRAFLAAGRAVLARDRKAGRPTSLLVLDLDRFKEINDRFGHATGDAVLNRLVQVATAALPAGALLARLGGDEFACLLPGTDRAGAVRQAERIRMSLQGATSDNRTAPSEATVSIGVASSQDAGHLIEALLATADVTLYQAKNGGRNRTEELPPVAAGEILPLAA